MFDIFCPTHEARVLLWPSDIRAIENTTSGIRVHYRCSCGTTGVWRTGRLAGSA